MPHEGGTWSNADTGGTGHYGGLQFSQATSDAFGGKEFASRPDFATREDQMTVADRAAFYGWQGNPPQGLGAWEAITKGNVPGITTSTRPPRPTPQYGSALSSSSSSGQYVGSNDPRMKLTGTGNNGQQVRLTPQAQYVGDLLMQQYPNISEIGTIRPDKFQWHPSGRGLDVNWPGDETPAGKAQGDQMKAYLEANKEALGIANVLWQVADHFDHIHVSLKEGVSPALQEVTSGQGSPYSYDGPGGDRNNPMYTQNAKDTGGEQLGKDIVSGVMEIFGFGDLWKSPLDFGLFKGFKGLMSALFGDKGKGQSQSGTDDFTSLVPGSGGGGLIDDLMGLIPKPYGPLNPGSPTDAPLEFIPGVSPGGGSTPDLIGLVPPGPGGQPGTVDASTNLNIVNPQYGRQDPVMAEVDEFLFRDSRTGLRNVPRP